jgi:ADP-ribose pyrophosphatase YjhB (NUDIX family)
MKLLKEIHRKDNLNFNGNTLSREAVRGIIYKDNKLLMIYSCKKNFDYKFPGGGTIENELYEDTLKRELLEETGYELKKITEEFGKVVEFDIPQEKEFELYRMTSYYYICSVLDDKIEQKLDAYEHDLGFTAEWVDIDKAISVNENLLKTANAPRWTKRETYVLKFVRDHFKVNILQKKLDY